MPIRIHPGLESAGIKPETIDQLIEATKVPLEAAKKRRENIVLEKQEVETLDNLLVGLEQSVNKLKTRYDFYKLKLDSSHPDIMDGTVGPNAMLGTYELEVRALARAEKELAYGFPDKDEYPVGFGYMLIEREDGEEVEIVVEPYTTLQELATQINDAQAGVRALVINTKYKPDPYRLLVISEDSGREAKIFIDEDTTFTEFKEQVTGRNLDVLFEDVPVTDEDNTLDELIDDITLYARRSEPGTRVQISVIHDVDATVEQIKNFVDNYNQVAEFVASQYIQDPQTGRYGILSGDGSTKMVMRQLQQGLLPIPKGGEKFNSLAEVGIITEAKTGRLLLDDSKVRNALTEDYDSVANVFIRTHRTTGIAEILGQKIRNLRHPGYGAVKSRLRGLDRVIDNQDEEIERRERQISSKEENIRRQFAGLEGTLMNLKGQSDFLKARFNADKKG